MDDGNNCMDTWTGYTDIKEDIAEELDNLRDEGATLENVSQILKCTLVFRFIHILIFSRNCQKEFLLQRKRRFYHCFVVFMS